MEKFIFFATLREKLANLNIPDETIEKHVKVFEDCFAGKSVAEIEAVINSAGGIDGIIKSVYNLENAKRNIKTEKTSSENTPVKPKTNKNIQKQERVVKNTPPSPVVEEEINEMTKEINAVSGIDDINKHIQEAEVLTNNLEKTTVTPIVRPNMDDIEFADDISEYDFEVLFAKKLTLPEKWIESLLEKMDEKKYKQTLPLAIFVDALIFIVSALLFPALILSAVFVGLLYIAVLIAGICFAIVPIGYGIFMSFTNVPIGLYELGLGLIVLGVTMLSSILLYNYIKRLVPFLFRKIKELFKLCIKITKRYFAKTVKEEK